MQWLVFNALGALTWVAGLSYAKGAVPSIDGLAGVGDHNILLGSLCSLVGLAVLLWANFRSPA